MGLACVILQGKRSWVIDGWLHPVLSLDTEYCIKYGCLLVWTRNKRHNIKLQPV